ncbi:hypothetical protein [Euzebya sp.]|uniref:hypothetical protein n=1 Tax=Euzebya sp. TaxID=1971409 RepID=UPI0035122CDB
MIDEQIPNGREEWPPELLEHLKTFRQGDVVESPPFAYWGLPHHGVLDLTKSFEGEGEIVAAERPPYGLILTQTCDLVEEDARRPRYPYVHLCPVVNGDEEVNGEPRIPAGRRGNIERGRVKYQILLPDLPGGWWVADSRLIIACEKGWLVERQPIRAFNDESQRWSVGPWVGRSFYQPAFAGKFVQGVQIPLIQSLLDVKKHEPEIFAAIDGCVEEFCLAGADHDDLDDAAVVVLLRTRNEEAISWLQDTWVQWNDSAAACEINLLPLRFEELDDISLKEYRSLTTIPLREATPFPDAYEL